MGWTCEPSIASPPSAIASISASNGAIARTKMGEGGEKSPVDVPKDKVEGKAATSTAEEKKVEKGKAAMKEQEKEVEEEEDFDDDDLEEDDDLDAEDDEEEEPSPVKKKAKMVAEGPSTKRKDDSDDSNVDDPEAAETVAGLSGDEVDAALIIPGGRRTRRGRAPSAPQYTYTAGDGDDSDDSL